MLTENPAEYSNCVRCWSPEASPRYAIGWSGQWSTVRVHSGSGVSNVHKMTLPPWVERNFTLDPSLFRGGVRSQNHKVSRKAAIVKSALENADFLHNARWFLKMRHLCGCTDHRALIVGEKFFDRVDFLDANRLRVGNGRNPSVQPWLRLMKGITAVASNGKNNHQAQQTHKRWVHFINLA